jgi:hypothetical protein
MVPEMHNTRAGGSISGIVESTVSKKIRLHLIIYTALSL